MNPGIDPELPPTREEQELINLRLVEAKTRQELADLRRPYIFRNSQLLGGTIAALGSIAAVFLLLSDNYFKVREQRNSLQETQTKALNQQSQNAIKDAAQASSDAEKIRAAADLKKHESEVIVAESNRSVEIARNQISAAHAELKAVQVDASSKESAIRAEELLARNQVTDAQKTALEAWHYKHTEEARTAAVASYARPILILKGDTEDVLSAAYSHDGKRILTGSENGIVRIWDSASSGKLLEIPSGLAHNPVNNAYPTWSPDSTRLLTRGPGYGLALWDAITGKLLGRLVGHTRGVFALAFSPDGSKAVSGSEDGTARIWDLHTFKEINQMAHTSIVLDVAFSPDGKLVVTADRDSTKVWEPDTGRLVVNLQGVQSMGSNWSEIAPGGRIVTTWGSTATVWDLSSGRMLATIDCSPPSITVAKLSPDGGRILTAAYTAVTTWDSSTGKKLASFVGHTDTVISARFSVDGKRVVTASHDGTVRVWNSVTGTELIKLTASNPNEDAWFRGAELSPDGRRLLGFENPDGAVVFLLVSPTTVEQVFH